MKNSLEILINYSEEYSLFLININFFDKFIKNFI